MERMSPWNLWSSDSPNLGIYSMAANLTGGKAISIAISEGIGHIMLPLVISHYSHRVVTLDQSVAGKIPLVFNSSLFKACSESHLAPQ
jgi:hypothetical protein